MPFGIPILKMKEFQEQYPYGKILIVAGIKI